VAIAVDAVLGIERGACSIGDPIDDSAVELDDDVVDAGREIDRGRRDGLALECRMLRL
jgi:hypothetical protein